MSSLISARVFLVIQILALAFQIFEVRGHGRLMWPPARGTVFRHKEFNYLRPKANYGDHALNCGGRGVQYMENGGKCGECGDDFRLARPRPNESGGVYDNYIIVAEYTPGQEIDVHVQLTANHGGFFLFYLCEHNNPGVPEVQSCFSKHLLQVVDRRGNETEVRTWEKVFGGVYQYYFKVKLPDHVTCFQCVLQWNYIAGNNWGACTGGTFQLGCSDTPEIFRGCADIAIRADLSTNDARHYSSETNRVDSDNSFSTNDIDSEKPLVETKQSATRQKSVIENPKSVIEKTRPVIEKTIPVITYTRHENPKLVTENTRPVIKNTKPVIKNPKSVIENTKPVIQNTKSVIEKPSPVITYTRHVIENTKPVIDNTKSVIENTKPVIDNTKSVIENTKPVIDNTKSVIEDSKPVIDNTKSVIENSKSVIENEKSAMENTKSVIENSKAVIEKAKAAMENTKSVIENSKSVIENTQSITGNEKPITENEKPITENPKMAMDSNKTPDSFKKSDSKKGPTKKPWSFPRLRPTKAPN